mgnify:CR=1 FL=1
MSEYDYSGLYNNGGPQNNNGQPAGTQPEQPQAEQSGYPNVGSSGVNTANTAQTDYSNYSSQQNSSYNPQGPVAGNGGNGGNGNNGGYNGYSYSSNPQPPQDDKYGGRLPVHVRLILDEFANIGQIPNFDKLIATIRSREISASIILQSQSQLKAIYKDAAEIISDNCDSVLFLSGRGKNAKEISDALGKETIDSFNTSENRGSQTSHGLNYQKLGKALMSEDEIAIMDGGRCILQLRGVRPFFSEKFDITKHPHYKYLADADKKNTFDVDRFLSTLRRKRQQVVAQDEPFDLYEIDLSDENATE